MWPGFRDPDFDPAACALPELQAAVWRELAFACENMQHGWRLPVLANVFQQTVRQRIVVLRHVLEESAEFVVHTDLRSPKFLQLRENPRVSWLFYDPESRVQLTVQGAVTLHTDDDFAQEQWAGSSLTNRIAFLAEKAPGTPADSPSVNVPENIRNRIPTPEESAAGRENFAVIVSTVETFDLLFIRRSGNLRAQFTRNGDHWIRTWLEP
ncbi:pyridoxamine 5'-phosphate oxidase family protein [Planctomicrobium sp. SH661]|uniref:pyridoxamine 5'-phosphate oxidase family protein n=1 Tax=Planctomicrobium sp. SH661 TaxID=3448124 RepID=UPI003F5CB90F